MSQTEFKQVYSRLVLNVSLAYKDLTTIINDSQEKNILTDFDIKKDFNVSLSLITELSWKDLFIHYLFTKDLLRPDGPC